MPNLEILALRALLAQSPQDLTTLQLRQAYDGLGAQFPTAADVERETLQVGGRPAEWTRTPGCNPHQAILYFHGGGYVIGSLNSHRHLASELGRAAAAPVLAIDYRLAPEAPFPAAVEDAAEAYRHLLASGFDPACVAFAGDSAGGGLVVAALAQARDDGLPQPGCALCLSPWVDLEGLGASMSSKALEDPMISKDRLLPWASDYLGGASPRTPLAAPLYSDFRGLAPLLIQVGSAETLLDDAVRLAAAAGAAGVETRLEIWPEMIHVWHFFHPLLGEARRALTIAGGFIAARLVSNPRGRPDQGRLQTVCPPLSGRRPPRENGSSAHRGGP